MIKHLIIVLALLKNNACHTNEDGIWDDTIKSSLKESELNAQGNSVLVTTKGDS